MARMLIWEVLCMSIPPPNSRVAASALVYGIEFPHYMSV